MRVRLPKLSPEWISPPGRFGLGIGVDCPKCGLVHRIHLWFRNPLDNGPQEDGGGEIPVYTVTTPHHSGFGNFTLTERVDLPCGWRGYFRSGTVLGVVT